MFVEVLVDITSYNDVMRMFVFQLYFMKLIYALLIFDLMVDINDPLLPVSLPRGYGGVAILWKKAIDHLVRTLPIRSGLLFTKKGTLVAVLGFSGEYLLPLCFSLGTILVV
jgi:hypothetical protein